MEGGSLHSGELPEAVLVLAICRARWDRPLLPDTRDLRLQCIHSKGMETVIMFMLLAWLIAIGHGI